MQDNGSTPTRQFQFIMALLGSLVSAAALISLVQSIGKIELADLPARYLDYYRALWRLLVDWIPLPFGWRLPQWYLDAAALAAIGSASITHAVQGTREWRSYDNLRGLAPVIALRIFLTVTLTGLAAFYYPLIYLFGGRARRSDPFTRRTIVLLSASIAATIAFFVMNAQLASG